MRDQVLNDVCPTGVTVDHEGAKALDHPGCVHCGKCVTEAPRMLAQQFSVSV